MYVKTHAQCKSGSYEMNYSGDGSSLGPVRESHRKNATTITAGMAGAHQALMPNEPSDDGPNGLITNMMALAHASALTKLRPEN